jgi:hypothetical protein
MAGARGVGALWRAVHRVPGTLPGTLWSWRRAPGRPDRGRLPQFEQPLNPGRPRGGSREAGPTVVAPRASV